MCVRSQVCLKSYWTLHKRKMAANWYQENSHLMPKDSKCLRSNSTVTRFVLIIVSQIQGSTTMKYRVWMGQTASPYCKIPFAYSCFLGMMHFQRDRVASQYRTIAMMEN